MDKVKAINWINLIIVLVFAFGISRVTFVTLVMGSYYKDLAENNTVRLEKVKQERGNIYDKNGKQLAINIEYEGRNIRYYPYGEVLAGVLGYIGKIDEVTLKKCGSNCDGETEVGRMGLEKFYQNEQSQRRVFGHNTD